MPFVDCSPFHFKELINVNCVQLQIWKLLYEAFRTIMTYMPDSDFEKMKISFEKVIRDNFSSFSHTCSLFLALMGYNQEQMKERSHLLTSILYLSKTTALYPPAGPTNLSVVSSGCFIFRGSFHWQHIATFIESIEIDEFALILKG